MIIVESPQVESTKPGTLFRAGAWCWVITGSGHFVGDIYSRIFASDSDRAIDDLLRAHPFDMWGMHRTYYEVTMGFSLAMAMSMVFVGILLLYIATHTAHQGIRPAALLGLVMSALALTLTALLEPPPPILLFSLATAAFALAARTARVPGPKERR